MKQEHSRTGKSANGRWISEASLQHLQEQVADKAKDAYEALVDVSSEALTKANRRATSLIRHYPLQAACGALAIGFLTGAYIARRRS